MHLPLGEVEARCMWNAALVLPPPNGGTGLALLFCFLGCDEVGNDPDVRKEHDTPQCLSSRCGIQTSTHTFCRQSVSYILFQTHHLVSHFFSTSRVIGGGDRETKSQGEFSILSAISKVLGALEFLQRTGPGRTPTSLALVPQLHSAPLPLSVEWGSVWSLLGPFLFHKSGSLALRDPVFAKDDEELDREGSVPRGSLLCKND